MKKMIFTTLIGFAALVSADPVLVIPDFPVAPVLPIQEVVVAKQGFFYVRFAAAEGDLNRLDSIAPGLGIGYRRLMSDGAADISISGIGIAEHKNERVFWTAPKASYIHYLLPNAQKSPYLGAGLAWGGVSARGQNFVGIVPSLTAGYEFSRKSSVLGFAELNVSQPAIAAYQKGAFPGPIAECTVGVGF